MGRTKTKTWRGWVRERDKDDKRMDTVTRCVTSIEMEKGRRDVGNKGMR